jgi:hypothetical protein
MKKPSKKLSLHRESIRNLTGSAYRRVLGGTKEEPVLYDPFEPYAMINTDDCVSNKPGCRTATGIMCPG